MSKRYDVTFRQGQIVVSRSGLCNADGTIVSWMMPTYDEVVQAAAYRDVLAELEVESDIAKDAAGFYQSIQNKVVRIPLSSCHFSFSS